jgi:8-oxo-dGTP pyrophosphatase MutT (NUDIX family)
VNSHRPLERAQNPFLFDPADANGPVLRPKDAAALVLVRRRGNEARVLMGERSARHAFLPGRFVFPGGRLDVADQRLAVETDLRPEVRVKVATGTTTSRAKGLALTAVRETFEETGFLVGRKNQADVRTRSDIWRRFFSHGVSPRLEALDFVARAITPPGRPRRFDARFFMADASEIAVELDQSNASGELLKPVWLTLAEARAADVLPITRCVLDEVEARLNGERDPSGPVPFFIPRRGKAVILSL